MPIHIVVSCDYCDGSEFPVEVEDPNDPVQVRVALEQIYENMQARRDNYGDPRPEAGAPYWEIPHWTEMNDGTLCCYDCVRNGRCKGDTR
jgi:hypothetical protein